MDGDTPTIGSETEATRATKIGIIVVHGIGEQGRFEFLDEIVRALEAGLRALRPKLAVSVSLMHGQSAEIGAEDGSLANDSQPGAEIVVADGDGRETRFSVHEVWWADIYDPPTVLRPLWFFLWGLGMWATPFGNKLKDKERKAGSNPNSVTELLKQPIGPTRLECILARIRLFLAGYLVLTGGVALSLLIGIARLLTRQNIPDPVKTAISYMSDVKLYTTNSSPETVPLEFLNQHARLAIRSRMVRAMADMALCQYDQWWVLSHSQGTVVAHGGLMAPGEQLAHYLDEVRWKKLKTLRGGAYIGTTSKTLYDAMLERPSWVPGGTAVDRALLLERFAGLVTYGSPLDKFATLWPETVPMSVDMKPLEKKFWVNICDATDPVAGDLDKFDRIDGNPSPFIPRNYSYAGLPVGLFGYPIPVIGYIPLLSHLRYLKVRQPSKPRKPTPVEIARVQDSLSGHLAKWWYQSAEAGKPVAPEFPQPGSSHFWPSKGRQGLRALLSSALWLFLVFLLPFLAAKLLNLSAPYLDAALKPLFGENNSGCIAGIMQSIVHSLEQVQPICLMALAVLIVGLVGVVTWLVQLYLRIEPTDVAADDQ